MAFSTKITFEPCDNKESSVTFDEVDYGLVPLASGFLKMKDIILNNFKSLNFKETNDGYIDFVSEISVDEFLKFHEIHYKNSPFDKNFQQFLLNDIQSGRYNLVVITVYEWESGLE
jgi:hypothetical protein